MGGKLDGKSALITGASRGIGKGIARVFLQEGARVFLSAKREKTLAATAEELSRIGPDVGFHAGDVSVPQEAEELIQKALEHFPDLTVLVNNASILGERGPHHGMLTPETWDEVLRVNTSSLFYRDPASDSRSRGPWSRLHHQCQLQRRPTRQAQLGTLRRFEIRSGRFHTGSRRGAPAPRNPGE